jgi:hypothetical protein
MSDRDGQDTKPDATVAIFEGQRIRRQWIEGRWYFSVIDVVGLLAEAAEPRTYWAQLKGKLGTEGASETLQL